MTTLPRKERESGAVLVFALLVLVSAAVIFAGLAQMSATQALVGGREWEEARQRITLANSRALARGFLLSRIFWNDGINGLPTNPADFPSFNTNFGGFSITNNSVTDFWAAANSTTPSTNLAINPFSPFERGGFYPATISATLWDGSEATNSDGSSNANRNTPWNFQVRLRSPGAAGFTFVRHPSLYGNALSEISGGLPNAFIDLTRQTNRFGGFASVPEVQTVSATNSTAAKAGKLSLPPVPANGVTAFTAYGFTNNRFQVNLANAADKIYSFTVPASNGASPVASLEIFGDTNPQAPPFLIEVASANTNLTEVVLSGTNNRPVFLTRRSAIDRPVGTFTSVQDAADWRIHMTVALSSAYPQVNITHRVGGGFTNTGSLRTDAAVNTAKGFKVDTNPAGLDFVADKMMWLEDARARQ